MTFHELFYLKLFPCVNLSQFFPAPTLRPHLPLENNAKKCFFSWSGGFSLRITRLVVSTDPKYHYNFWTSYNFLLGIYKATVYMSFHWEYIAISAKPQGLWMYFVGRTSDMDRETRFFSLEFSGQCYVTAVYFCSFLWLAWLTYANLGMIWKISFPAEVSNKKCLSNSPLQTVQEIQQYPVYKHLKFKNLWGWNFHFKHPSHKNHFTLKFQSRFLIAKVI